MALTKLPQLSTQGWIGTYSSKDSKREMQVSIFT